MLWGSFLGRLSLLAAAVVLPLVLAQPAGAVVIFEQAPTLDGGGLNSDTEVQRGLDDFVLASAATVNHVRWYGGVTTFPGVYEPLNRPITFTIAFYGTDPNPGFFPAATSFSEQVVTIGNSPTAVPYVTEFEADLLVPVDLAAGTRYWIAIVGHDLQDGFSFATPFTWGSAAAAGAGAFGFSAYLPNGGTFGLVGVNLAFALESVAVPEPGTLALLAGGIGLLALRRRRRS